MKSRPSAEWEFYRRLGANIRQARIARQLSRRELAALVGAPQEVLWSWEQGRRGMGAAKLQRIADALLMTLDELVDDAADCLAMAASGQR